MERYFLEGNGKVNLLQLFVMNNKYVARYSITCYHLGVVDIGDWAVIPAELI